MNFEDYVYQQFAKTDGVAVLDDDLPEAYLRWIDSLVIEDWYRMGDEFADIVGKEIREMMR